MKILFTGASSLTGMWFVKELAKVGHEVTAIFRSALQEYTGIRLERVNQLLEHCQPVFNCTFGSDQFLALIQHSRWDLFCHHAADVTNYRSPQFDFAKALANNTHHIENVFHALQKSGCNRILLTGSVFEQREGSGTDNLRAVSPYGLSKGLSSDVFLYFATILKMKLGKFVIPNPFGPFEEGRFTTYLIETWGQNKIAAVNTPDYVRDNIPTSLLAKAYAEFASQLSVEPGYQTRHPSCYKESQGAFTTRFANEMRTRLQLPCQFELKEQTAFQEPLVRVNTESLDHHKLGWNEEQAWDELANFYMSHYITRMVSHEK